jgi:hypothetical protein
VEHLEAEEFPLLPGREGLRPGRESHRIHLLHLILFRLDKLWLLGAPRLLSRRGGGGGLLRPSGGILAVAAALRAGGAAAAADLAGFAAVLLAGQLLVAVL